MILSLSIMRLLVIIPPLKRQTLMILLTSLIRNFMALSTSMGRNFTSTRKKKADEILKQIKNGEDVTLVNCITFEELNVSKIKLETVSNPNYLDDFNTYSDERLVPIKSTEHDTRITTLNVETPVNISDALFKITSEVIKLNYSALKDGDSNFNLIVF